MNQESYLSKAMAELEDLMQTDVGDEMLVMDFVHKRICESYKNGIKAGIAKARERAER